MRSQLLLLLIKGVERNLVQTKNLLVGVLDEHVLAVGHLHAHVDDGSHNTPSVVQVEVHLGGEIAGLEGNDAEDDVAVVVLGVGARNETTTY